MPKGPHPHDLPQLNLFPFDHHFLANKLADKFWGVWSIGHLMNYSVACSIVPVSCPLYPSLLFHHHLPIYPSCFFLHIQ